MLTILSDFTAISARVVFIRHPHLSAGDDAHASPQAGEARYRQADHREDHDRGYAAARLS